MATMLVQHRVKDYTAWKEVFDSFYDFRISNGEVAIQIFRDAYNPNALTVLNTWDTLENAQKFAQSPDLKATMMKAGVVGPPNISFLTEI